MHVRVSSSFQRAEEWRKQILKATGMRGRFARSTFPPSPGTAAASVQGGGVLGAAPFPCSITPQPNPGDSDFSCALQVLVVNTHRPKPFEGCQGAAGLPPDSLGSSWGGGQQIDTWEALMALFIAPSLCSD